MSNDVCGLFIPRELESNSAALLYSINMATKKNKDDSLSVDLKKAGKIYKFIKENVKNSVSSIFSSDNCENHFTSYAIILNKFIQCKLNDFLNCISI